MTEQVTREGHCSMNPVTKLVMIHIVRITEGHIWRYILHELKYGDVCVAMYGFV